MHLIATLVAAGVTAAVGATPPQFELVGMTPFPAPLSATRFIVADLDQNGTLDLVCPGRNLDGRIYLVPGNGDGTFAAPIEIITGVQTDWVQLVDVDGDGTRDLVLAVRSNRGRFAVMRGIPGSGGFGYEAPVMVVTGRVCGAVATGDPDGSGRRPVYSLQYSVPNIHTFAPGPALTWDTAQILQMNQWSTGTPSPMWMGRADVTGDGIPDLACIATGAGRVNVYPGRADGTFDNATAWQPPQVGSEWPGLTNGLFVDLDGDGHPDFAAPGITISNPPQVIVFRNDGSGGFGAKLQFPVGIYGLPWDVAAADVDGDGDQDLVVVSALNGWIDVLENTTTPGGPISMAPPVEYLGGTFLRHVEFADLDGDCAPDIVAVDQPGNYLIVYRNVTPGAAGCGVASERGSAAGKGEWPAPTPESQRQVAALTAAVQSAAKSGDGAAIGIALGEFGPPLKESWPRSGGGGEGGVASPPPVCGPQSEDCLVVHEAPGCYTPMCCETVCGYDPACCEVTWDQLCVDFANSVCDDFICPSPGSCFEVHLSRGCSDQDCCGVVGSLDPFCAGAFWDELCVTEASRFCSIAPCSLGAPPPASIDEQEPCYKRLNEGCNSRTAPAWLPLACGDSYFGTCDTDVPRDTDWFSITVAAPTSLTFTVNAEFPARVLLMSGPCEGPLRVLAEADGYNCIPAVLSACVDPGTYSLVIGVGEAERVLHNGEPCDLQDPDAPPPDPGDPPFVPGFFGLHWHASMTCSSCGIPGDINGDGKVNGADLGILLGNWGTPGQGGQGADLNGDGVVNGADLGVLLGNWTG